ncbi:polysaccharide pyruvyl transferase family protein [Geoalkalibacter subterraneus]|uniref:polysaccharide pyruvyl transferase family protein n=1 Tax=Geoalkalibacter subterraneus TaxID=483547 RepID=UPI000A02C846|nr:polysaccharide pyruvyl transferase family protein [Geoalkalibacter subterraneus]
MKILIDNSGYDILNVGDTVMLRVALARIKKILPHAKLSILTRAPEVILRSFPGVSPLPPLSKLDLNIIRRPNQRFYKWLPWRISVRISDFEEQLWLNKTNWGLSNYGAIYGSETLKCLDDFDAVIGTGGGYLNSTFEGHAISVLTLIATAQRLGKPTFLVGQGIGPIKSKRLALTMEKVLNQLDLICIREKNSSYKVLEELCVDSTRIRVTGDDAIELAFNSRPNTLGDFVGLNFRKASYSAIDEKFACDISETICDVVENLNSKIIPIPISLSGLDDDEKATVNAVANKKLLVNFENNSDIMGDSAISAVGNCRVVVTASYHAGLFALSQGVSVLGIAKNQYYADKFNGLADMFGNVGCTVWHADRMHKDRLREILLELWSNADLARDILLEKALEQINLGDEAYLEVCNILDTSNRS